MKGQEEATKAVQANTSPRYKRLESLERWVTGEQYCGKPSWWDDEKPLWERAPCIVYPVVEIAAQSNVDLCLAESRWPTFKLGGDPGKPDPADDWLREYHRVSQFQTVARDAFFAAQGCGTAVTIHGIRNGRPFAENYPAKWCERTLDADGAIEVLTIEYPYLDEVKLSGGEWEVRAKLYRRVIDKTRDVVYLPADATASGSAIDWKEDPTKSATHGLGFVPAVWYAFMRGTAPVNVIDGKAIHALSTDEIQAHDIARSQWHRGALLSEPQIWETGVSPGYSPTEIGRKAVIPSTEHGGEVSPHNAIIGEFQGGSVSTGGARKKGPGYVWQYSNDKSQVGVLLYPGDALKAQQDNCSDLRIKIQEMLCVVFLDPENIKFAATTSGKALQAIKQRQIDRCSKYRDDFRDNYLIPSLDLQLKLAAKVGAGITVPGLVKRKTTLPKDAGAVEVTYGSFYKPDPAEQKLLIEMLATAVEKGFLDSDSAIRRVAQIFDVEDVEALIAAIKAEKAEQDAKMQTELKRWTDAGNTVPGNTPPVP